MGGPTKDVCFGSFRKIESRAVFSWFVSVQGLGVWGFRGLGLGLRGYRV